MRQIEQVAKLAEQLGYTTTKMQYVLISKLMAQDSVDISPEDCMKICNLQRYCRMVLGKDEVALKLAEEWKSQPVAIFNQEEKKNTLFAIETRKNTLFALEEKQTIDRLNGEKL